MIPNARIIDEFFVNEAIEERRCPQGKHFPEYVYQYEERMRSLFGEYYAHCAICGTDYQLKGDEL